jgi:hypothetical protein
MVCAIDKPQGPYRADHPAIADATATETNRNPVSTAC